MAAPASRAAPGWPALLARACAGHGIDTVFQPIVDVARGVVAGYEALTRFGGGPGSPEAWFAAAREHGCADRLDAAALRAALRRRRTLPPNTFLAVNVSPRSLPAPAVRAVWAEQDSLGGVVVEITEQTPIDSYALLQPDIDRLRAAGALIAVDDAGAGYAGLRHLVALRPEIVKLDRDLVADLDVDETKRALAEMIGTFAGRIDAWLLAEGIERSGELEALVALGIPLAQGYYLGRPGPPWAPVNPYAERQLRSAHRDGDAHTVRTVNQVAPVARSTAEASAVLASTRSDVVVLVDEHDRPVAALSEHSAALGVVEPGLRVSLDTPVRDAALRALTRTRSARFAPLLCTDPAGRYVGVATMERVIAAIATS